MYWATLPLPETRHALPVEGLAPRGQHLRREVHAPVAGGLGADERAAPVEPLAGEDAGELVPQPLVLAEEEPDLAPAHADVARGDVGVGADVAEQLGHEALAEAHDLDVALALGIEVRPALAAAHRQRGERVLEDLLEGQELQDAQVHRGVEPQPALVGADRAVHLDAVAAVDLDLPLVVHPRHPEHQHPLGLDDALDDARMAVLGMAVEDEGERLQHLLHRLVELRLRGVLGLHRRHQGRDVIGHRRILSRWGGTNTRRSAARVLRLARDRTRLARSSPMRS